MNKAEFVEEIKSLPELPSDAPRFSWLRNRREIQNHVGKGDDPEQFLNWSTIRGTMFVGETKPIEAKYNYLLERGLFRRYKKAIREHNFGGPSRLSYDNRTSGNILNQAYHLSRLEDAFSIKVENFHRIVEFGGGYGAMCAVVKRLGFEGEYHIFDLPELAVLQEYYLTNIDIEYENIYHRIIEDGNRFDIPPQDVDLFIACYSLSEAPEQIRKPFFGTVRAKYVMVVHQSSFNQENLTEYFDKFVTSWEHLYDWTVYVDDFSRNGRYLLGKRIDD
jgi:hypothetical protein